MAIKKISANLLANNAVHTANIASGAISAADIADNSITAAKLSASTSPTFGGLTSTGDVSIGGADSNNAVLSLTADTGNWVFTNVRSSRNLEISDSDGTGTVFVIDTSGNVGIGTTVPAAYLGFDAGAYQNGTEDLSSIRWNDVGTADSILQGFTIGNDGANLWVGANSYVNSGGGISAFDATKKSSYVSVSSYIGGLAFGSAASGNPTEAMRIDSDGDVGIGTPNPTSKLTLLNNTQDGTTLTRQYATFGPSNSWLDSDTVGWAGAGLGEVQIHNGTANRPPILSLGGNLAAGELLGAVNFFRSSNTDTYRQRAYIASGLTSSGTVDQYGADLRFATADNGATSPGLRMQINGSQTEVSFLRANNWHNGSLNTVGGPAIELGYSGSLAYVHGYNRNASQYVEVAYDGSAHRWYTSGGTPNMFLTANGQLLCNFQTPASTSNFILGVDGGIGLGGDDLIAAGSGYGPSNGAGGYGSIKLYDGGTGDMQFNQTYSNARYFFYHGGNEVFRIEDGGHSGVYGYSFHYTTTYGRVGVGALNSGYHHTMVQSGPSTFYWSNRCEASGGFHTYSDERLKENITTISGALDKVALMNGVTFNWIDAEKRGGGDTGKQFGVIAQNMLTVDPELPSLNPDPLETQENIDNEELETDYYTMDYSRITPFLIEAIKELKTKLEAAEARITQLEG